LPEADVHGRQSRVDSVEDLVPGFSRKVAGTLDDSKIEGHDRVSTLDGIPPQSFLFRLPGGSFAGEVVTPGKEVLQQNRSRPI
jgi:hypothetical protein